MIYGLDSITDKKAGSQSGAGRNKIFCECGQFGQDWKWVYLRDSWGLAVGDKEADYVLGWHLKGQMKEDRKEGEGSN